MPRDGGAFQGGTVSAVYPADALKSFTPPLLLSPASQLLLNFVLDVIFFFFKANLANSVTPLAWEVHVF